MLAELTSEALAAFEPIMARFRSADPEPYCHVFITGGEERAAACDGAAPVT